MSAYVSAGTKASSLVIVVTEKIHQERKSCCPKKVSDSDGKILGRQRPASQGRPSGRPSALDSSLKVLCEGWRVRGTAVPAGWLTRSPGLAFSVVAAGLP